MTSGHTITAEPASIRYYLPRDDIRMDRLVATDLQTTSPSKEDAQYWSVRTEDRELTGVAWSSPEPIDGREDITGLVCFFDERVDELLVDGIPVAQST